MPQTAQSVLCFTFNPPYSVFTVNDPDSPVCSVLLGQSRILCSRSMPQTAQSAIGRVNAPDSPVCSVFTVNALLGQCHVNAPDSPVCSVFTVNALLGQCRILSMPQTAQSVLCSRSMPYWVNAMLMPQTAQSVLCSQSMPYWVNAVNAPDSPVCSVFTVNALLGQCRILSQTAQFVLCFTAIFCVHGQ